MRNLILISIVAVILSSCAGVQNTAYTDDLYYIPQDKNQQLPTTADEQTSIVENKEALNYKKQESYDGFAESYNDQEEEYQESYIATDYSSRLRRFHGVYVYDPYYLLDPWYYDSWRYPSYGFGYYPTVGIGWNSYWGFNLGIGYNWYNSWYGYYPYGGSYWSGYHDGYWSANYHPTNRYTGAFTHRSGFNNYSTRTSAGTNATNRKRGSASQAATTNNLSRKNTTGNALSREVNNSGSNSNFTRPGSTNSSKVNTTFTRPASGSNSNARSYYNLDHNIKRNTTLINNSRSIQPNTNSRVGTTRQNQPNRTQLNIQQNQQNFRQPSSRPNQNSTIRTNRTIQNSNNQRNYTPSNNSGTRSNVNQSSPSRSSSSGNSSRNSSSGSSSSPRRR